MEARTLCEQVAEILEVLPESVSQGAVLKPIFEDARTKNSLLDRIIRRETSCADEITGLLRWSDSLRWNLRVEAYPIDKELKSLVSTHETFFTRFGALTSIAESEFCGGVWGIELPLIIAVPVGAIFLLLLLLEPVSGWGSLFVLFGLLFVVSGFLGAYPIHTNWIRIKKRLARTALAQAKWLDGKIQLVYQGERS